MGSLMTILYGALGGLSMGMFHFYISLLQLEDANKIFFKKYNIDKNI